MRFLRSGKFSKVVISLSSKESYIKFIKFANYYLNLIYNNILNK